MEHCGGGGFGAIKAIALAGPGTDTPLSSPASPTSADRIRHPRPAGTCSIRGELVPGPTATTPVAPIHRDKISSKVLRSDESRSFGFARTKDKSAVTTQQCFRSGSVPIDLVAAALLRGEWRNDVKVNDGKVAHGGFLNAASLTSLVRAQAPRELQAAYLARWSSFVWFG
ncbi:hypothetical protein EJB05_33743, partial [Eragrostis curvula]